MFYMIIFGPFLLLIVGLLGYMIITNLNRNKMVIELSKPETEQIVRQAKSLTSKENSFKLELMRAGLVEKEYKEGKYLFILIGLIVGIVVPIFFQNIIGLIAIAAGIVCIVFGGKIYLSIAKAERIEKIEQDLGTFLDLVNVILEAGGSLKNAFFTVSTRAHNIIDKELLKEIAILEYEMTNYGTKEAYLNLKKRVDSDEISKVVDFLVLSEETGIGVKNIFTTQSAEMRQEKFYKIKGKVNTLNMYLMLVIFIFILPAVGAFVVFPMMAGTISTGF
eukprot:Anaeramoba_ignava/a217917_168.p4 GENE.a217917_168~~a217917_168.p4  ORF type:complete len:277 (+),score=-19.78 a217917_168:934-1764(+)